MERTQKSEALTEPEITILQIGLILEHTFARVFCLYAFRGLLEEATQEEMSSPLPTGASRATILTFLELPPSYKILFLTDKDM